MTKTICVIAVAFSAALMSACRPAQPGAGAGADTNPTASVRGDSGVTLAVDQRSYAPGATVAMTITNSMRDTLAFNPCTRSLERQQDMTWTVFAEPSRMCTMEAWLLKPGETRSARTELPPNLLHGTYRFVIVFSAQKPGGSRGIRALSPPFQVE